ncbi:MAG: hypothetical protein ABSF67_01390 [Roseiarcus sp.]
MEDEEFRITSRGSIIHVAWYALGVNLGWVPTTEAWLDEAAIEDASAYFKGYEVRTNATSLPDWVASKPVLMWDTEHGPVLLDGRQRAAKRFSEGQEKVRALIVKKAGRKVDLEGFTEGLYAVNPEVKKPLFATMDTPRRPSVPDLGALQIVAALLEFPAAKDVETSHRGKQLERPEWHRLKELLVWSVYVTWVAEKFLPKKKKNGIIVESLLSDVGTELLNIYKVDAVKIKNSLAKSIRAVVGFKNAREYELALRNEFKNASAKTIRMYLQHIKNLVNLEQRAIFIIESHDRRMRAIYRIAQGKGGKGSSYKPEHLLREAIRDIEIRYNMAIKLEDRYHLARFTGINITDFYFDARCVRILGRWWTYVYQLENQQVERPRSLAMQDTFLQRLAMKEHGKKRDQLSKSWNKLFGVLKQYNKLDLVERQCWDATGYPRP